MIRMNMGVGTRMLVGIDDLFPGEGIGFLFSWIWLRVGGCLIPMLMCYVLILDVFMLVFTNSLP